MSDAQGASPRGQEAHQFFLEVQDQITQGLEQIDQQQSFKEDLWTRDGGGGGRTRVIEEGRVFEKGGVNVSCVYGELSEAFAKELPGEGRKFFATGISLVIHPKNPHVPTVHANFRYLEKGEAGENAWFGGGADLTPWILYEEDARHFHKVWKESCDRHPEVADFDRFKKWCDEYFYLPHRKETRGIGGIFYDYLGIPPPKGTLTELPKTFDFAKDAAKSFLPAYLPIVERRLDTPFTEEERKWQLVRRGRYVEFNLIYDRGTTFGLRTNGRVESILMSLPNLVSWQYAHQATEDYQKQLLEVLHQPRNWLA